ncbi:MAG: glycosyltransferase [Bacteroidota bacterium]
MSHAPQVLLSILIPEYNWDSRQLVNDLLAQLYLQYIAFEIILADDASPAAGLYHNFLPTHDPNNNFRFIALERNLGRATIRNFLAGTAQGKYLLFIDCDSELPDENYISRYIQQVNTNPGAQAVSGGTIYSALPPEPGKILRWTYGNAREAIPAEERSKSPYSRITLNNFLVLRSVMMAHPLDENIKGYGHEDTLFGYALKNAGIRVVHINNPVIHTGLESAQAFLDKTREGVMNFYRLSTQQGMGHESSLWKAFAWVSKFHLAALFRVVFKNAEPAINKNLCGPKPNIRLMDILKLGYMLNAHAANTGHRLPEVGLPESSA